MRWENVSINDTDNPLQLSKLLMELQIKEMLPSDVIKITEMIENKRKIENVLGIKK